MSTEEKPKRKLSVLIVSKTIEIVICNVFLYSLWRLFNWMWPQAFWLNVTLCGVMAIDYALIVSEIKPNGFRDWFGKKQK